MAEDRTKADVIKGTFLTRSQRLQAKGPRGDGTIPQSQYDALYGILWDACEVFCWIAQTDSIRQDRAADYDENTGQITNSVPVDFDDRVWIFGAAALQARRRKLHWLVNRYISQFGPMSLEFRELLRGTVTATERRAAITKSWDNHPLHGQFQGNADDPDQFDFEII